MAKPEGPQATLIPEGVQDPSTSPAPQVLQAPQQPVPHMLPLNLSYFKPNFSGKPDEDAETHLCSIKRWMNTHRCQKNDKVQKFCLTLTGEARLWYESLRLINTDWMELQNSFTQQYSKIGNTREQLFHA